LCRELLARHRQGAEAFQRLASHDAANPRAGALQYAGQTAVLYLMGAHDKSWASAYSDQALNNIKDKLAQNQGCTVEYRARRDDIYRRQGYISADINLIPPHYLGADADRYIRRDFANFLNTVEPAGMNNNCAISRPRPAS
jgi:hypothetical protein